MHTWIPGYENIYKIGEDGTVLSFRNGRYGFSNTGKQLHGGKRNGYFYVILSKNGVHKHHMVSRLVLEAFAGPAPFDKPYALHNDGNPSNNNISNLRWGSNSENQNDRNTHGTSNIGEQNGQAKLTEIEVRNIKRCILSGEPNFMIHRRYPHVDCSVISAIRIGRLWKHIRVRKAARLVSSAS